MGLKKPQCLQPLVLSFPTLAFLGETPDETNNKEAEQGQGLEWPYLQGVQGCTAGQESPDKSEGGRHGCLGKDYSGPSVLGNYVDLPTKLF